MARLASVYLTPPGYMYTGEDGEAHPVWTAGLQQFARKVNGCMTSLRLQLRNQCALEPRSDTVVPAGSTPVALQCHLLHIHSAASLDCSS